ncbi:MAG: ATP-binding protein [Roseiflexaceae bacterium]
MPNPQRLLILTTLREQAGLSLSEMARRFGLHGTQSRKTVSAWERGELTPRKRRRVACIGYLWDDLRLRKAPDQFAAVWDILVDQWGWEPIGDQEWRDFTGVRRSIASVSAQHTVSTLRTNLPAQTTALVGRERELSAVMNLLERPDVRLVTLTGPGGIGKTRLGLQVAASLLDTFADGAYIVNLAPVSDPTLVAATIAQSLGMQEIDGQALLERLKAYFRDKYLLLLLDNFEQILAAAPLITELLIAAARLKVLVTSRAVLHLSGEHEFAVPPLELPEPAHLPALNQLTEYEALQLFEARAQAVKTDFVVTSANAPELAKICYQLDGLPLAIELAAARIKLLSPEGLLARLGSRLALLTGGPQDLPARQQTLRNTLDWSYNLLTVGEQILFRRSAVFVGGCTLEAIESVCNVAVGLGDNVLDGVAALVDKSLLRREEGVDGAPRFTMLETSREYALERLAAAEEGDALRRRHAAYYFAFAQTAKPALTGPHQRMWLDRLEQEHDNLRAAIQWALEQPEAEIALLFCGAAVEVLRVIFRRMSCSTKASHSRESYEISTRL